MIVHYILQNKDTFETDIKADGHKSVYAYCDNMLKDGIWGDGICLQAFSLIFGVNVYVYDAESKRAIKVSDKFKQRPNVALHLKDNHYDRILEW